MLRSAKLFYSALAFSALTAVVFAASSGKSVLNHTVKTIDGQSVDLSKYQGKVVLVVNVASRCGLTYQYEGLQALYEKYKDQGLVVLGFPCNQFGGQESGTNEEIQKFCSSKYHVTFDMFDKIEVNGDKAAPFYQALTSLDVKPKGAGKVRWNFEKFVINKQGEVVGRFDPKVTPDDKDLVALIQKTLAE